MSRLVGKSFAMAGQDKQVGRGVVGKVVRRGGMHHQVAAAEMGQQIGMMKVWRGENVALEAPLYAENSIAKGSMTQKAFDTASELMIGMFRAGAERALAKEPKTPKAQ